jgi:hypothetical protein
MDWPWLPVEEAARPAGLSRSWRAATRLTPPRTLKAPTGWRFSHLTYASHPSARPSAAARRHGVGSRYGAMRRRARRTSWMVGSQSGAPSPVVCALMSALGPSSTVLSAHERPLPMARDSAPPRWTLAFISRSSTVGIASFFSCNPACGQPAPPPDGPRPDADGAPLWVGVLVRCSIGRAPSTWTPVC